MSRSVVRSTGRSRARRVVVLGLGLGVASVGLTALQPVGHPAHARHADAGHRAGQAHLRPLAGLVGRRLDRRRHHLGPDPLGGRRLPPPRAATRPPQTRYNLPIEILYTVLPLIIIAVLFGYTARDQTEILKVERAPAEHGQRGRLPAGTGRSTTSTENTYDVGTPAGPLPTLWLPVDETVKFTLTSPDVIHSFWVPAFLFKMDVIPGRTNQFELTPTKVGTTRASAPSCAASTTRGCCSTSRWSAPDEYAAAHGRPEGRAARSGCCDTGRVTRRRHR